MDVFSCSISSVFNFRILSYKPSMTLSPEYSLDPTVTNGTCAVLVLLAALRAENAEDGLEDKIEKITSF